MSLPTDGRILGLSPRARRFVVPVFIAVVLVITIGSYMNRSDDNAADSSSGPIVRATCMPSGSWETGCLSAVTAGRATG